MKSHPQGLHESDSHPPPPLPGPDRLPQAICQLLQGQKVVSGSSLESSKTLDLLPGPSLPLQGPPRRGPQVLMQPWCLWVRPRNFQNRKDVQTLAQLPPNRHKLPCSHPGPPHPISGPRAARHCVLGRVGTGRRTQPRPTPAPAWLRGRGAFDGASLQSSAQR